MARWTLLEKAAERVETGEFAEYFELKRLLASADPKDRRAFQERFLLQASDWGGEQEFEIPTLECVRQAMHSGRTLTTEAEYLPSFPSLRFPCLDRWLKKAEMMLRIRHGTECAVPVGRETGAR